MRVKFKFGSGEVGSITLTRESGDPKFHGIRHAKGEHALLHYLARHLNARGFELIKVRAQHDMHMVGDEFQPYLRPPKQRRNHKAPDVYIISGFYALHGANEDWNDGEVTLDLYTNVCNCQPNCKQLIADLGFEVTGDLAPTVFEENACV